MNHHVYAALMSNICCHLYTVHGIETGIKSSYWLLGSLNAWTDNHPIGLSTFMKQDKT